jgi:2-polyprenyl-6-methoxyphenol hydroxylase-like FAD-dependent oxidoreductase
MRIAVVGAGVAGLTTATLLSRAGHAVTLLERQASMPEAGGGLLLQPCGLAVLEKIGVLDAAQQQGSRIARLVRQHVSGEVTANLSYEEFRPGCQGLGISRGALTALLLRSAIASGVTTVFGCAVAGLRETLAAVTLQTAQGAGHGDFAAVVVADGMRSMLRSCLGLRYQLADCKWGALSVTAPRPAHIAGDIVRQRFRRGADVIGLLPSGRDAAGREYVTWFQNMAVAQFDALDRIPFSSWREQALGVSPESRALLMPLTGFEALQFSRYATVAMPRWSTARCVVVGDAAHALDPLLGMGANMALVDAATLAEVLSGANEQALAPALQSFQSRRAPQIARYQRAGAMLSSLMHSDHPLTGVWPDLALRAALRVPAARRQVMAAICGDWN